MTFDTRILVFPSQNEAAQAVQAITGNMGLSGSTFIFALPFSLADGRWSIPHPTDDAWLAGVSGYTVASGTGTVAVGEGVRHIPVSITNFQARAVLFHMPSPSGTPDRTLFQDIDDALRAQGGVAWQAWEFANDVTRDGPLVNAMGANFGLTSDQLDALFIAGAGISA